MKIISRKSAIFVPVLLAVISLSFYACRTPPETAPVTPASDGITTARVTRVIDGDTIVIEGDQRVRYIGIDTPEVYPKLEAFGEEARQANRRLVEGKLVRLERDVSNTDRYGRLLRHVFVDGGTFVSAELVRQGLAEVRAYPPDLKYQAVLEKLQQEAQADGLGLWTDSSP
jgi:micrococcal nuclease